MSDLHFTLRLQNAATGPHMYYFIIYSSYYVNMSHHRLYERNSHRIEKMINYLGWTQIPAYMGYDYTARECISSRFFLPTESIGTFIERLFLVRLALSERNQKELFIIFNNARYRNLCNACLRIT